MTKGSDRVLYLGETAPSLAFVRVAHVAWRVIAAACLASAVLVFALDWIDALRFDKAYGKQWSVSGPSCPVVSARWVQGLALTHHTPFAFEGVSGSMASGATGCTVIDYAGGHPTHPYTVCQFSSPFVLTVSTRVGPVSFEPGVGRPATISMRDGHLACVIGATQSPW